MLISMDFEAFLGFIFYQTPMCLAIEFSREGGSSGTY